MIPTEQYNFMIALESLGINNPDDVARELYNYIETIRLLDELSDKLYEIKEIAYEAKNNKHIKNVFGCTNKTFVKNIARNLEDTAKEIRGIAKDM